MEATGKRPMMAAIGCAIILTVGLGSTSLLNAIAVLLVEGMNTDLVTYAFGPMLATVFAFLGSLVGTKLIDKITPKCCLLIWSVCTAIALTLFAMATGPLMWYVGNVINGVVLAIGAHASAAGVLSRFYGERTPTVFGVVVGVMSFIIAGLVFVESLLLQAFDYRTIIFGYAALVLVLGVLSNVVLIGKVPEMPALRRRLPTTLPSWARPRPTPSACWLRKAPPCRMPRRLPAASRFRKRCARLHSICSSWRWSSPRSR